MTEKKDDLRLVDPSIDRESYEAFSDLLPENINYKIAGNMLFGAIDCENIPVGLMAVGVTDDLYQINWLYVNPNRRRMGVGTFLLKAFLGFLQESLTFREVEISLSTDQMDLIYFIRSFECFDLQQYGTLYSINSMSPQGQTFQKLLNMDHHVELWQDALTGAKVSFLEKVADQGFFRPVVSDREITWPRTYVSLRKRTVRS